LAHAPRNRWRAVERSIVYKTYFWKIKILGLDSDQLRIYLNEAVDRTPLRPPVSRAVAPGKFHGSRATFSDERTASA
jgi:hypothetical protein